MGYDFHITRKTDWAEDGGPEISAEEWREATSGEEFLEVHEFPVGDTSLQVPADWHARAWLAHPDASDGLGPAFTWLDGRVDFRHSDPAMFGKALELARSLGARVVGDEGEEVDEEYARELTPEEERRVEEFAKGFAEARRPASQLSLGMFFVGLVILVVGFIVLLIQKSPA